MNVWRVASYYRKTGDLVISNHQPFTCGLLCDHAILKAAQIVHIWTKMRAQWDGAPRKVSLVIFFVSTRRRQTSRSLPELIRGDARTDVLISLC